MPPAINLARVIVTDHAARRWHERTGRPAHALADSLRAAVPVPRQARAKVWHWLTRGHSYYQARILVYCPRTRAVFLLAPDGWYGDGTERWKVVTVTTLDVVARAAAGVCPV